MFAQQEAIRCVCVRCVLSEQKLVENSDYAINITGLSKCRQVHTLELYSFTFNDSSDKWS